MGVVKLNTLKKNKEFGYVYRRGSAVRKKYFTMLYAKSRYGGIRAGFQASKKVGNSVVRNRARRRMKEAMRRILPDLAGNYSIVFVLKQAQDEPVFTELVADIASAMEKAHITERGRK